MPINPWILAALVFAGIGLLSEFGDGKEEKKETPAKQEKGKRAPSSVNVTVNTAADKKAAKKPAAKVIDEEISDG